MRALIRFWQSTLTSKRWLMDSETREMIQETIRCLKEADKISRLTQVERQAEAVRIAKESLPRGRDSS